MIEQTFEHRQARLGPVGGKELHQWQFEADRPGRDVDAAMQAELVSGNGAYVMGRNMLGPIRGDWRAPEWDGWWGPEPPYHAPVFVLTHHPRESLEMEGGTTFHFVTDGFDAALAAAKDVAGDLDVDIAGGASVVHQALRADVVDQLIVDIAPRTLGRGERLFPEGLAQRFTIAAVDHSPLATHIRYERDAEEDGDARH